ncbi:MAG: zinc-binding dehydrogenase [Actinomycetota bacterium]
MRAAVMRGQNNIVVDDVPDPVAGTGQILAKTLACGICGSDLHFLRFADQMVALGDEMGPLSPTQKLDVGSDIIMGHEFCAEVLEVGPDTNANVAPGDYVVSMPVMVTDFTDLSSIEPIGAYSNRYGGAYSEMLLLSSILTIKIPNGLDPRHAAMTEPMAVGVHAVNRSGIKQGDAAVVLGAGPVGLAVIAGLKQKGIEPIVAADFSPKRRALAAMMGAHKVVDPRSEPAIEAWRRIDGAKPLVIFEAVGVPGMLDQAMKDAPRQGRVLVVGACMESDTVRPLIGVGKELEIRFALGYDPMEFGSTLRSIAEGEFNVAPLITGSVGISGVPQAFTDLSNPEAHCKILVEPSLD